MSTLAILFVLAACGREGDRATPVEPAVSDEPATTASLTTPSATPVPSSAMTTTAAGRPVAQSGCRNSTAPSCGAFRFDPAVDDDRLIVTASASSREIKAGQTVTFTVRASDPDSRLVSLGTYRFGKDSPSVIAKESGAKCPRAYGPWDPPKADDGALQKTLRHTYRTAGTHEAIFTFYARSYASGDHAWPARPPGDDEGACVDPYASAGKAEVTVRVSAP
jgi:hypothetical protein